MAASFNWLRRPSTMPSDKRSMLSTKYSTTEIHWLHSNKILRGCMSMISMRKWLPIIRGSLYVTRSAGLYPISTSIRTRPTTGWMNLSILALLSQNSLLLTLIRLLNACTLIWTFRRPHRWGAPCLGWPILVPSKEDRNDLWFSQPPCYPASSSISTPGSSWTPWTLRTISTSTTP